MQPGLQTGEQGLGVRADQQVEAERGWRGEVQSPSSGVTLTLSAASAAVSAFLRVSARQPDVGVQGPCASVYVDPEEFTYPMLSASPVPTDVTATPAGLPVPSVPLPTNG